MLKLALVSFVLAQQAAAQYLYDFNRLSGSDPHPFTLLDGQDNWTEQTYNAANRCGVTATLSHDGTPSLRFQEVGPGYGCDASRINDSNWAFAPFPPGARNASFQADMLVGYWGGSFGLAFDTNSNGTVRGSEAGERGVFFKIGTQANVQLQLVAADGTATVAPLASLGITGGHWVRLRVVMDLPAAGGTGLGWVDVRDITAGATEFTPVPALQGVPLALNPAAVDASNPSLWHALWLHFEGATYGLDNVEVGRAGFGRAYGSGCAGAAGIVELAAHGTFARGQTVMLESNNHAAGAPGVALFGVSRTTYLGLTLPFVLDPFLGTNGCSLLASAEVSVGLTASNTTPATMSFPLTISSATFAASIFTQHACIEPVAGGISFSNGLFVQLP
ncbi:MAG: hypothetical protein R3F56_05125 [Planctomycetota bacterium]